MRSRIINLSITFISFILLMIVGDYIVRPHRIDNVRVLDEVWNVVYNDTSITSVKLSQLRGLIGSGTKRGDSIILTYNGEDLEKFLDSIRNASNSDITGSNGEYQEVQADTLAPDIVMLMQTRFSAYKVLVNGEVVSRQYYDEYERGDFIGCDYAFIDMPLEDSYDSLRIEFKVAEDGAYNSYEAPVLGRYMDVLLYRVYTYMFVFFISAFLIIFGIIFFAIAVAFNGNLSEMTMHIFSALLYIALGSWFLTQFNVLSLFMDTYGHETEMEYISLFVVTPLMYLVMGSMRGYLKRKSFLFFVITGTIVPIALIVIHFAGLVHINRMLPIYQIDAVVFITYCILMLITDTRKKSLTHPQIIQLTGLAIISVSFIINVIFYYIEVAGIGEQIMLSKKAVPIGAMCMVFATLVNYHIFITQSLARRTERATLAHLAYADGLTGIPNRARYEKYISDLTKEIADYCIISIDLNGFKKVNDELGHLVGDRYLTEFGKCLSECLNGQAFVARMGGDEFVAVLSGNNLLRAQEFIQELRMKLDELNKKDPSIYRNAACGFAYRHEVSKPDMNAVYLLADERMYLDKRKKKQTS